VCESEIQRNARRSAKPNSVESNSPNSSTLSEFENPKTYNPGNPAAEMSYSDTTESRTKAETGS